MQCWYDIILQACICLEPPIEEKPISILLHEIAELINYFA